MSEIEKLPDELWLCIINFFPIIKWIKQNLYIVNRRMNRLLNDENLWKTQCIKDNKLLDIDKKDEKETWRSLYESNFGQIQAIKSAVYKRENVFITGSGGVGKTHVLCKIVDLLREKKLNVEITASTGVAAVQIEGTTLHSFVGLGLAKAPIEVLLEQINKRDDVKARWKKTEILIIDEISMIHPDFFKKIDRIAKEIKQNQMPFGGIQIIVFGDFFQLIPIDTNNDNNNYYSQKFCFQLTEWENCIKRVIILKYVHRQKDVKFINLLERVRRGIQTKEDLKIIKSRVNPKDLPNCDGKIEPTRLYPNKSTVKEINNNRLAEIKSEIFDFVTYYSIIGDERKGEELIRKFISKSQIEENLRLKIGAQVMLIINLSISKGLINGSRAVVTGFRDGSPIVKFINGIERRISYHDWNLTLDNKSICVSIKQIPLILAWALTIHKCNVRFFLIINVKSFFFRSRYDIGLCRDGFR